MRESEIHPTVMIEIENCNTSCALWRMFVKNICKLESSLSRIFENSCAPLSAGAGRYPLLDHCCSQCRHRKCWSCFRQGPARLQR